MKLSLLLFLNLILISCGLEVTEPDPATRIGEIWEVSDSDKLSQNEIKTLENICLVLKDKENHYKRTVVHSTRQLKYDLKETACGESKPTSKSFKATVQESFGKLSLNTTEGKSFNSILLADSKEMSDLCESEFEDSTGSSHPGVALPVGDSARNEKSGLPRAIKTGSTALRYYFYNKSSSKCQIDGDEVCMYIEVGYKTSTGAYKTKDINAFKISLNTSNNFRGLVLERALVSSDVCSGEDETYLKEQFYMGYN